MASPSEPLLQWLRDMLQKKGMNAALVAQESGIKRSRVRRILSGTEPMTVDELLQLSEALSLSPADMGMPIDLPEGTLPDDEEAEDESDPDPEDFTPLVNPWLNHHKQLFQIAFALGCNFAFTVRIDSLTGSGVPQSILDGQQGPELMIQLDAAFHTYNNPIYASEHVLLTLSFDTIYDCSFPWDGIERVFFSPAPVSDIEGDEEREPVTPHLRLVT
jgi:transcriptional regulator with XRE-family HTH domain